jgi:glycosyltransferase involved in cell wall biosynthesis
VPLSLSIVIPIFNEEESILELHNAIIEALQKTLPHFEVIYVNDGSTDDSKKIISEICKNHANAKSIHFVRNYGQTAALTAGIRHANADILVTMDGDLQNDPRDIPMMLEKLQNCDVVCGWRKNRQDNFLSRTLPSKIANGLISRLSNVPLHDYGCTLRVYKKEYIKDIPLYGEMHRFIPIYVTWAGAKIIEVPVRHHPRRKGVSKYGLRRIPKVLLDLTTLKFLRDFFVTPIYFFGWVGIISMCFGILSFTCSIYLLSQSILPELSAGLFILGPVLGAFGIVEITLGIIAEVLIRMHFELQKKDPYRIQHTENISSPPPSS